MINRIAAQDHELFLYALLTVMNRLAMATDRFGIEAANSNNAARVAETDHAVFGVDRIGGTAVSGECLAQGPS